MPDRRSPRRLRWGRLLFGVLAAAVALADIAVAVARPGNLLALPEVTDTARPWLLAYGAGMLVVAALSLATCRRRETATTEEPAGADESARYATWVVGQLRSHGWYVADRLQLPNAEIDHVAVGPAGVLAIQQMWTNRPDPRGRASIRARIGAQQLRGALAKAELDVEVVPAVVVWGPGQDEVEGGVKVVDSVAVLFGDQAGAWLTTLTSKQLLDGDTVEAVRSVLAHLHEADDDAPAVRMPAAAGGGRSLTAA